MKGMRGIKGKAKPCPFCGNERVVAQLKTGRNYINGLDQPIQQHKCYIQCTKCKARGALASGKVNLTENYCVSVSAREKFPTWQTTDNELKEKALILWNERAKE